MSTHLLRFFVLLLAVSLLAAGCAKPNKYAQPPPPPVTVAHPELQPVQEYFTTNGQTRAVNQVQLRARVSGYLDGIQFQDGQMVQKDQVLFTIDKAPYEATAENAKATLAKAEAGLSLAEQVLARAEPLVQRNAVSQAELDQAVAERRAAVADVAAGQAAVREAELNLGYTEIRAPFTGRIGRRMVDPGNLVQPGDTMLGTLETVDPIHIYFVVSESDFLRFLQMPNPSGLSSLGGTEVPVEIALGTSDDYKYKGTVDFQEFGVDPATGTTQRRAVLANADEQLRPGLFVRVRVPVGGPEPRILVDERAVGSDQRGTYLLSVSAENKVVYRQVKLGIAEKGKRVVLEGIGLEDQIIIDGLQRARPGIEVVPQTVEEVAKLEAEAKAKAEAEAAKKAAAAKVETDKAEADKAEAQKAEVKKATTETATPAAVAEPKK